jgi:hypothetical protein
MLYSFNAIMPPSCNRLGLVQIPHHFSKPEREGDMPFSNNAGTRIRYEVEDIGPALVLLSTAS